MNILEPATHSQGLHLAIINGWSMPEAVWSDFLAEFSSRQHFVSTQVIDLDESWSEDQWLAALDNLIQPNTLLVGWSLGGMLAVRYASEHAEKLVGVCCVQMTPKFVAGGDWLHGMAKPSFSEFAELPDGDSASMIKQFGFMATAHSANALKDFKKLRSIYKEGSLPSKNVLHNTLKLLETLDVRAAIPTTGCPQLYLYGERDMLVPAAVADDVTALFVEEGVSQQIIDQRRSRVKVLSGVSHCPLFSAADVIISELNEFIGDIS